MKISSHQFVDNIQEQFAKFTSDKPLEIAAALTFLWGIGGTPCSHCAPMPQLTPARRQCDQCRPRKRRGRPPHLRVHGTANLFVTDASVFPSNMRVNAQYSTMAIAHYAMELHKPFGR
jgi:GMC oxidoreductase